MVIVLAPRRVSAGMAGDDEDLPRAEVLLAQGEP
jgi:hypothetical protein